MSTITSGEEPPPPKRIRRRETEVNSLPPLSFFPWKDALENVLESGHLADVIFIVGGGQGDGDGQTGRREIVAHKLILSARSEVFRTMMEQRWNNDSSSSLVKDSAGKNGYIVRIEIDPAINPNAFEQIIKFIYNDDVASCLKSLEFEEIFEFRSLAEMYGFIQLKDAASYKIAHDLVKDYRKCFLTLEQEIVNQDLRAVAFSVLKWRLAEALAANDMPLRWTEQIWEYVLSDESLSLEEVLLFQSLWRWKEYDPCSREATFQKLLQLIRFPIMSSSELLDVVRVTGALSSDELLDIWKFQSDRITPNPQQTKINFSMKKRGKKVVKWVTSFKELMQILDKIPVIEDEGGAVEIFLLPGDYCGIAHVNKNFVKLTGFGPYTVFRGRQSGIKISSNQTTLSNLTLQGTLTFFHVIGNCNSMKNIVGTINNPMFALVVKGASNVFENFSFLFRETSAVEIGDYELDCEARRKEFVAFLRGQFIELQTINDVASLRFVWSDGPRNKFANFQCTQLKNRNAGIAIEYQTKFIVTKKDNVIQNVDFDEISALFDGSLLCHQPSNFMPHFCARLYATSTGLRVSDCSFDEIKVPLSLSGQHHFKRVVVAKRILVNGSDHKFEDCRYGEMEDNGKNTVTSDCVTVPEWLATDDEIQIV